MPKKVTQTKKVQNHIYKHQLEDRQGFFLIVPPSIAVKNGIDSPADSLNIHSRHYHGERASNSKIWSLSHEHLESAIFHLGKHMKNDASEIILAVLAHTEIIKGHRYFVWGDQHVSIDAIINWFNAAEKVNVLLLLGCSTVPLNPSLEPGKIVLSTGLDLCYDSLYHFYCRFTWAMDLYEPQTKSNLRDRVRTSRDKAFNATILPGTIHIHEIN